MRLYFLAPGGSAHIGFAASGALSAETWRRKEKEENQLPPSDRRNRKNSNDQQPTWASTCFRISASRARRVSRAISTRRRKSGAIACKLHVEAYKNRSEYRKVIELIERAPAWKKPEREVEKYLCHNRRLRRSVTRLTYFSPAVTWKRKMEESGRREGGKNFDRSRRQIQSGWRMESCDEWYRLRHQLGTHAKRRS